MRRTAFLILLALTASGCGSSAAEPVAEAVLRSHKPKPKPEPVVLTQEATVRIAGFAYGPRTLHVHPGTRVIWRNDDISNHTITFRGGRGPLSINDLQVGSRTSRTFLWPGRYAYVCALHPGMRGTVVVG
jgi:plastocyanin